MSDAEGWKGRRAATPGSMGKVVDMLRDLRRRVTALERRSVLNSASISSGGLRIKDGGDVVVEDGGNVVVQDGGELQVVGTGGQQIRFDDGNMWLRFDASNTFGRIAAGIATDGVTPALWLIPPAGVEPETPLENNVIVVGRGTTTPGAVLMRTPGRLQGVAGEDILLVGETGATLSADPGWVVVRGASGATLRATGGDTVVAAEAGALSILQDAGGSQWYLGRSGSVAAAQRAFIWSPGGTNDLYLNGDVVVTGSLNVNGAKQFRTRHPLREGHDLAHASTESPVSGVEYWGEGVIGEDGTAVVDLPYYFEALVKPTGRAVLVSPIGPPSLLGADRVVDGTFTVHGEPGAEFSWLVKGERFGGDFEVEPVTWNPQPDFPNNPEPEEAP